LPLQMEKRLMLAYKRYALIFAVTLVSTLSKIVLAQSLTSDFYNIGNPTLTEYYVDPSSGNDNNNGTSRSSPKRTVSTIWNVLRENQELVQGVRINLLPGTYGNDHLPNYWENRLGSESKPIIIRALDGFGTVNLTRDINMANVSYFYLIGISIQNRTSDGYGDAFHCERCNHILLRGNSFNGAPNGRSAGGDVAHETIKFNQSQYIYIENNNIQGADDNGIDFVAVQYGHIRANRIHDTDGWCAYVKGGSSYILIEANRAYECGEGGITAGQGTGFEFMTSPWTRFEANYIKIVNNIIYDINGAALGINGGYAVLVAHNTAYKIGTRSHLLEVVYGERSCDGDTSTCSALQAAGGWGPTATGSDNNQPIGNQDIIIANNIFYNPSGTVSGSQHFAIYGPRTPTANGIPSPQRSDNRLKINGNIIWNGTSAMPLGIEESDQGCQNDNLSCNQSLIRAENTINSSEPDFLSAISNDFRPTSGGRISSISAQAISDHLALDSSLNPITEGTQSNQVTREFSGALISTRPPGAFASYESSTDFPSAPDGEGTTPDPVDSNLAPELQISKVTKATAGRKLNISITAVASDSDNIASVVATILSKRKELASLTLTSKNGKYIGKKSIKNSPSLSVRVTATDSLSMSTTKTKKIK
jgi:Right handed beta helix region